MAGDPPIRRALLSVSDKAGLVECARTLAARGVELVSTGGTARALREAGLEARDVADLTGFPEMLDGRVKTLHPAVHGGLLARRDDEAHRAALETHGIGPIDLVVVNLYPFTDTVTAGADRAAAIENIDIGGPAMIRSAAKNHAAVTVLTDPADYAELLDELGEGVATSEPFRIRMAARAFARTAAYDAAIANWFAHNDAYTHPLGAEALGRHAVHPHHAARLRAGGHAALRREPASGGRRLPAAGGACSRRAAGQAVAGQGAQLQQSERR